VRHPFRLARTPLAACLGAALLAGMGLPAAHAATLPVTNCADDGSPGTLRSVVNAAANGDIVDLTQLACSKITLTQGPIDTNYIGPHPLNVLTLQGPGRELLTISGGSQSLVFSVGGHSGYGVFTINDLTIADGINAGSLWHESPGCIDGVRGDVVLNRVTVTGCHSVFKGGFSGGGAVGVTSLYMTDSLITDSVVEAIGGNTAQGGGAWAGSRMVLVRSTVTGNRVRAVVAADGYGTFHMTGGGGVYSPGDMILIDSTITGNTVEVSNPGEGGRGGGVAVRETLQSVNSTIEGNTTDGDGGGVYKFVSQLINDPTEVIIENSTISGNQAGGAGGALASQRQVTLANSTLAFNDAMLGGAVLFRVADIPYSPPSSVLHLQSTIIASNTAAPDAPFARDLAVDGELVVDGANNLVMQADPAIVLPMDTLAGDPRLLPLDWNGGLTRTHGLAGSSPARDAGNNAGDLSFDQRGEGYPRVIGPAADIGAFEAVPVVDAVFADGFEG
jgi:hypothetical protein